MMLLDLPCQNRGKPLGLELRLPLVGIEEEGARVTPADNIIEADPAWRLAPASARRPRGLVWAAVIRGPSSVGGLVRV